MVSCYVDWLYWFFSVSTRVAECDDFVDIIKPSRLSFHLIIFTPLLLWRPYISPRLSLSRTTACPDAARLHLNIPTDHLPNRIGQYERAQDQPLNPAC